MCENLLMNRFDLQALTAHTCASVLLLEKETSLVAGAASSGNSGLGCTGYDAPPGSLERRLLQRSIRIHQNLYRSFGLSLTGKHVRKCGSLIVAWTEEELAQLPHIVQENRDAGDTEAILLEREELLDLEPALSSDALGAVFCPREAVVEPWYGTASGLSLSLFCPYDILCHHCCFSIAPSLF